MENKIYILLVLFNFSNIHLLYFKLSYSIKLVMETLLQLQNKPKTSLKKLEIQISESLKTKIYVQTNLNN